MNNPYAQQNQNYKKLELEDQVNAASPHELINILFKGAKSEIKSAMIAMQHKNVAKQAQHISKADKIVAGLKSSVNVEAGGALSENLIKVYDFVSQLLLEANMNDDAKKLELSYQQLNELAQAWEQIAPKENV